MTDTAWIATTLTASRPRAMAALLRRFRELDTAEEAFQEACLRALQHWPAGGPPRDPLAWLIFVGRNAGVDELRRRSRHEPLPDDEDSDALSHTLAFGDSEASRIEQLDHAHYRDDVLRLLFVCCHPALPLTQQIALALRIVSGLSVREIARAFLVGESAMEQRITRARKHVASAGIPFDTPGRRERDERLAAVCTTVYLLFNEGYAASGGTEHVRAALCEEAIRLARLLLALFPDEPELMGLAALLLLQHARAGARLDAGGLVVLLEDQNRALWNRALIGEGLALAEAALRQRRPGPYQLQAAIAGTHAQAARADDTDWGEIDRLYAALETLQPSPVVTLNRAVAVNKLHGPRVALSLVEPLADALGGYFHFHGLRGALLLQLGLGEEARAAFARALALARTAAEAAHIRGMLDRAGAPH
ncbi:RNA polymerase, sigma subunit, ECF family [Variovorax sp. OK605]|uniref:RNA polymerase sigma factor n=1 Tax=Variovorax sp. OK605 TaxID=1855317 RepID=UPI0008E4BA27|nr:RNA polymerase sigma factor [Variovorax sp. OK605]SFP29037.1 RNA polymerase, sigma subunit, ECF family [Variovorax sp. OK605]